MTKQTNNERDTRALKSDGFTCTYKGESIRKWEQTLHGDHTMTVHLVYTALGLVDHTYMFSISTDDGYVVAYADARNLRGLTNRAIAQVVDAWSGYYITHNDLALIMNMFK